MSLFDLAKHYTGRSAQQSLLIACFSLLEDVCFYFPNENAWVWSCVWRRMLISCQERSLQVSVATAAMQTLANLLPSMLEEMLKCAEDLYGLLDTAHIREGWSNRPRYHRNRNGAVNYESRYCRREGGEERIIRSDLEASRAVRCVYAPHRHAGADRTEQPRGRRARGVQNEPHTHADQ